MQLTMAIGFIFTFIGSLELILTSQIPKTYGDNVFRTIFIILSVYFIIAGVASIITASVDFLQREKIKKKHREDVYIRSLPSTCLAFGITGIALTLFGLLFPATLFASNGLDKGIEYQSLTNNADAYRGKIIAGRIMSKISLVLGLIELLSSFIVVIVFTTSILA